MYNTVAFPTDGNGNCPAAMDVMPDANAKKLILEQPEAKRLLGDLKGKADIWGKRRKVGAGQELCFQVFMQFPEGILTSKPNLDVFLPPEAELIKTGGNNGITFSGTSVDQIELEPSSMVPLATDPVDKPEKRTPLRYTFKGNVAGGTKVSMIYKATIKNTSVVDPEKPDVIYDNLAKLSFKDFEGGYSNACDLAGYEYVNPLLMLSVDKKTETVQRGSTTVRTYQVTNVGSGPVAPETKVLIRLPEGVTCNDLTVGGGATKDSCVDGATPNGGDPLITGGYLVAKLTDAIGSKDPNSDNDQKSFTLAVKANNSHGPSLTYDIDAGILGYKGLTANPADPSTPVYIPKTNKFCKTQTAPTEETDKACTLAIGEKVFGKNTPADALGKTLFTAGNTAPGGLSTHALTQLTTGDASLLITGTSSDVNQKGSHNNIVVPGEKGSISVTVRPNQSVDAASTPSQLTWANAAGNVRLELKVSGVNGLTPAQHFKALQEIKTAATTVFGGLVSEGGITLNNTSVENGVYTITIPLNGFPGQNKVLNLPDLFVATKSNVVVEGKLHYKALNLKHRDSQNNQFNTAPVGAPRIATAPALTFNRLVPTLTVNKSVTRPTINRITGQSEIDYQIVITNTSNVTAYGVKIKDTLPDRFKHRPSLTSVTVTAGISPSDLDTKKPWSLTDSDKVGEWPVGETINIPSGGVITIAYTATSPDLVTTAQAYTNNVAVPFASQPGSPVGAETYNQAGSATVHGENILSTTTITAQNPRHTNGKVQVGELVTTTTRITIPTKVEVQNLSVLTTLSGATFDRSNATVRVTCGNAPGLNCDGITALLNSGDPTKLGVNVSDTNFQNNTGAPIEVTVEVQNLLVTGGTGPIVAVGNAYRGPTTPTSPEDITTMTKASGDSTGEVPIQTPGLNLTTALVTGHTGGDTGMPVTGPIEPGTPDLFAKIELVNPVSGSDLRQVSADIASKLDAIGLAPANGFTHANWNNGSIKLNNLPGGDDHKFTLFVPVTWKEASFKGGSRLSGEQTTPVNATGKTGPLNSVSGALAPETEGNPVVANSNLTYTPLYPVPAVSVGITKLDGGVLSTETPPVLKVGDEAKVTFTPTITGAKGYNPVLCVKAENIDGSVGKAHALAALELLDPSSGVGVVDQKTACGSDEIEVKLPQPDDGKTLPPVSFKVASSGGAITEIMHTKITATLKVSSQIDRGTTEQPGPRDFTATTDQKVNVSPSVDIKVTSQWFKPSGEPFGDSEQVVYNDFDTESTPVKAKISIQNIGSDAATPQGSTVKVKIPTGFTIDGNPDTDGWTCKVTTGAGHDILTCERNTELPGNQAQPFIVTIKSPHGPGVRLTTNPLVIQGGHNDDRGAASPFDHNPTNDQVNTQATVRIPTPDLAPVVTMNDTILRSTSLTKPFTVTVTNNDDGVRANEARLQISTNAGGGTLEITKPNGWNCSALVGTYVCVYPNATTGSGQVLPTIEGTVTVPTEQTNSTVQVGTQWQRPGPGNIPTTSPDKNPANDTSFVQLVPFNDWVDGKVTVEFKTPNPNQDQEAEPIIRIIHNDGGGSIPPGSKVKVKVPDGATVGNTTDVNNCSKTDAGTETTPATWTCDITRVPTLGGPPLEGPTVTGFTGPNQKIVVTLEYPDPKPTDPDLNNNTGTGTTAPSAPVPGPQPPKPAPKPTPIPDPSDPNAPEPDPSDIPAPKPEDRPTTIPQPPTPPASPAPANPGRTPVLKEPEERANGWIESVYPAEGRAPIVLIGRDNVFADSLSSGGLQGILDAPLLLNPVSHLSDKTKATLDRLQPEQVIILGGPVAQSPAVEAELKQLGWNVSRVHGPTRVETAIDAATVHAPDATHGILARAYASDWGSGTQAFADALSGGALAARQQRPVFLTPTGELTDTLRTYLAKAKITHLTVVGSTEAVSSEVEAELHKMGITTNRISGENRAETAINVAQSLGYWHAGEAEAVLVVNGESEDAWTDAFPAALYAKRFELPVVLSGSNKLLPETFKWLAPGVHRTPPTRVICGYSVGPVKQCAFSPAKAPDQQPMARPTAPPTP